ncbi:unnamed protein product [Cunninghamella blakesleeana]
MTTQNKTKKTFIKQEENVDINIIKQSIKSLLTAMPDRFIHDLKTVLKEENYQFTMINEVLYLCKDQLSYPFNHEIQNVHKEAEVKKEERDKVEELPRLRRKRKIDYSEKHATRIYKEETSISTDTIFKRMEAIINKEDLEKRDKMYSQYIAAVENAAELKNIQNVEEILIKDVECISNVNTHLKSSPTFAISVYGLYCYYKSYMTTGSEMRQFFNSNEYNTYKVLVLLTIITFLLLF